MTILVVMTAGGLFFLYNYYTSRTELEIWDIIPSQVGLVYEPHNGRESVESFYKDDFGKAFAETDAGVLLRNNLTYLDSLFGVEEFNKILSISNPIIAIEPFSSTDIGFLIVLNMSKVPKKILTEGFGELNRRFKASKRNYNNYTINELRTKNGTFAYSMEEGFWFGSFTPVMVEDVIRQFSETEPKSFKSFNPELFKLAKLTGDDGNIYINNNELTRVINVFLDPLKRIENLNKIAKSGFFDINISKETLLLNGFSYKGNKSDFFNILENSNSKTTNIRLFIPSSAALFYQYQFGELDQGSDLSGLLGTIEPEISFTYLEAASLPESDYLLYLRIKDAENVISSLQGLAEVGLSDGDTVYYENFSDFRITELRIPDFYSKIHSVIPFKDNVQFYTIINDLVVVGNSVETIKSLILDIETENTWGKSVVKTNLMTNTLDQASFSVFMDIPKVLFMLKDNFHSKWKEVILNNDEALRKYRLATMQFSVTDNKLYTNITLSVDLENSFSITDRKKLDPDVNTELSNDIVVKPAIVRNHNNGRREVITQTSDNILVLLSPDGDIEWADSLSAPITGEIYQIDYFKNGKFQYFFGTDSALHVIDRNGVYIEGFPVKLHYSIDFISLIDYDNSREYRYLISDIKGNLYMYDKSAKSLDGWEPNVLNGRLLAPPAHLRVRGKDCIVAFQQRGNLCVMNRRGEMMPGFPLKVGVDITPEYAIQYGKDFSSSYLRVITEDGLLSKISLTGKIAESRQILRLKRDSKFSIVPDVLGHDFVIARKEIGTFTFLNSNGDDVFMESLISSNNFLWQYYNFGSNRKLYAVTDTEQEFSYLYNEKGELINKSPINSGYKIGVIFSESKNEFKIYTAYSKYVNIYSF